MPVVVRNHRQRRRRLRSVAAAAGDVVVLLLPLSDKGACGTLLVRATTAAAADGCSTHRRGLYRTAGGKPGNLGNRDTKRDILLALAGAARVVLCGTTKELGGSAKLEDNL